ncbi:cytochrome c [Bradyrhizobium sp. LHD-71]|uniref:c-type cytochrome n=1 Tax=Bradyrhizobium sp. LHD-71 TaxID=3072141 RepID=UPI00280C40F9|nr:cytochrome c [Bradyrhizobium sp. LHD-71]MDQ8728441.1 cytochrome c [Bradyrhizobium sp. LHD-71]
MIRVLIAVAAVAFGASTVIAQQDAIAARKALMKATGGQTAIASKMVKGEEPFDLTKAKGVFASYQDTAAKAPALFPPDSKEGDTAAHARIWEAKADFDARFAKMGADAKAAEAKVTDLDSFKAAFNDVAKNCGGCHNDYRVKR